MSGPCIWILTEQIDDGRIRDSDAYPSMYDGGAVQVIFVEIVISMVKSGW
jgi:hypothetical protein